MALTSPIYWSPRIYRAVMRALYGSELEERYRTVDRLIPDGSRVVELCCGCGYLYEHYLRHRRIDYLGLDLLPAMMSRLRKMGARVEAVDVVKGVVPNGDYVIMLGSLYHFHPQEACILRKMAASGTGIVLEPTQNLSQSTNCMIRLLARSMSFISGTSSAYRLTSARMDEVIAEAGVHVISTTEVLHGQYRLTVFQRA